MGFKQVEPPPHILITVSRNSGCVLLARDNKTPVGFCFSFLAFNDDGSLKHHSHQAAVVPGYQGYGIGSRLKWRQREFIQKQGVQHTTWTFDPLEAMNARLNIHKLGAVCSTYKRNVYGSDLGGLNIGMATDRFLVDWWLDSPHVLRLSNDQSSSFDTHESLPTDEQTVNLNTVRLSNGFVRPLHTRLHLLETHANVGILIPNNIQEIKDVDMGLARSWRSHTRELFESAFDSGFAVVDVIKKRYYSKYLLQKTL